MGQTAPTQQPAPSEAIVSLNQGYNGYTDPTLTNPRQLSANVNCFSGAYGYIQRARFANVVTSATTDYTPSSLPFTSLKFFALPGLSNYLLGDVGGKLWSFDTSSSYAATQRLNPYVDPSGAGSLSLNGPFSREVLQNIVYEMNGTVKMAGRGANAATIEGWGLDAPDASPQVVISAGSSQTITNIQRSNAVVTVTLGGALTVPGGNGVGMVNVTISSGDTSFAGVFVVLTGSGTATLTWAQTGQNTALLTPTGTVNTNIVKATGRSYAWAWENANKANVGAPSPSTQFIRYASQNGAIQLIQQGTIAFTSGSTLVTGTGTAFTSAWVGRSLLALGASSGGPASKLGRIASVNVALQTLTLATAWAGASGSANTFQVYDPQATHVRLYATPDGGATYYRVQRNTFNASGGGDITTIGLEFFDNANSEPPNFPFTTETSQLFNVPPPIGQFVKEYQGRLLIYGVPGLGQTFFYTNNELTSVGLPQESSAPLNQVTLPIQNANINGMAELPGSLIIWSDKQDMFRMTGLLSDNSASTGTQQGAQITALPYNLGCASPFSVVVTPLGAIWLTTNNEVWLFTDRYAPRNVGRPIQDVLNNIPKSQLTSVRAAYYHTANRNWYVLAVPNGSANNVLLILDLDLLASNGSPSYFIFDMATNQPTWFKFSVPCTWVENIYETNNTVRLLTSGSNDTVQDVDYFTGNTGTEVAVTGATFTTHAWGNDSAPIIKRPSFLRFQTNRDPSLLASDGWSFGVDGIDDDFYTFAAPLSLALTPGVNDSSTLGGNPLLSSGSPFRHSPEIYKIGGVNFVMGRRLRFTVNFPSGTGVNYQFRSVQLAFGPTPPR